MSYMFANASSLVGDQANWNWDTSNVTNMSYVFSGATNFNGAIGNWKTGNVTNFTTMFMNAKAFNQPLGSWDTSKATLMPSMFAHADSFNQPIGNWNTSGVTNMFNILAGATSFNQSLATWDLSSNTNTSSMLSNTHLSVENYEATLAGWSTQSLKPGLTLGANGLKYCDATARNMLTRAPNNWTISGDSQVCPPSDVRISSSTILENTTVVGDLLSNVVAISDLPVKYQMISGAGSEDNSRFNLTQAGALEFITAPDFENPTDLGDTPGNNTYSIRVKATTNKNQSVEQVLIITVLDADEVPPVVTITSDQPVNQNNTADYPLAGTCTAGDEDLVISTSEQTYTTDCSSDGTWNLAIDLSSMSDGKVEITVKQTDNAGNIGQKSATLTKDTVLPIVTLNSLATNSTSPSLSGLIDDPQAVIKVLIANQTYSTINNGDGTWSLSAGQISPALIDGDYAVTLTATDMSGNTTTQNLANALTIDTSRPSVTINQADGQADPTNVNSAKFIITFSEKLKTDLTADSLTLDGVSADATINLIKNSDTEYGAEITNMTSGDTVTLSLTENKVTDQPNNQATSPALNQSNLVVTAGTCQAGIIKAQTLSGNLAAPEANIVIIGGITYQLSCEDLGGDAIINFTLGEYYNDLSRLRIYKQENNSLVDITNRVNLRNEGGKTQLTMTLIDGADYDEDGQTNRQILDPIFIGLYQEAPEEDKPLTSDVDEPGTGIGAQVSPLHSLSLIIFGAITWLIAWRRKPKPSPTLNN